MKKAIAWLINRILKSYGFGTPPPAPAAAWHELKEELERKKPYKSPGPK